MVACEMAYDAMERDDFEGAVRLVEPWAKQGDAQALRYMVILVPLTQGIDATREWVQAAQRNGVTSAMVLFAEILHLEGLFEEALYWYTTAADAEDAGAAAHLGFRAAELGDFAEARRRFAQCLQNATENDATVVAEVRQNLASYGLHDLA